MDEEKLVRELKKHSENALREAIKQYGGYVKTIVCNVNRGQLNSSDIEEISADVFLSIWNNSEKIPEIFFRAYIGKIARNSTIDRLRRMKLTVPIDEISIESGENIEYETERKIIGEQVRDLVDKMECSDREIILRFYFYYQSIKEISSEMNISESAAKTKLHRARKKLLQGLKERGVTDEI